MSQEVEMVPVFFAGQRAYLGRPSDWISRDGANDLIITGLAEWVNLQCKSIRLKKTQAEMAKPQPSLTMGPWVSEGAADGDAHCVALVESWTPLRLALCA